jgi:hypothetical protein
MLLLKYNRIAANIQSSQQYNVQHQTPSSPHCIVADQFQSHDADMTPPCCHLQHSTASNVFCCPLNMLFEVKADRLHTALMEQFYNNSSCQGSGTITLH